MDPRSSRQELAGGVERYPLEPEKKTMFCHSRRIEKFCHLFVCTPAANFFFIIRLASARHTSPDVVFCCSDLLCAHRCEQTPRPTAVGVVWWREETRWVRCTARRTPASEPTLTAFLWSGDGETCRVNLSWYFVLHNVIDCCCCCCCAAAAAVIHEYVATERCAPSALLLVSSPKPAPADCCSLAAETCARR